MFETIFSAFIEVVIFGIAAYFIKSLIDNSTSHKLEAYRSSLDKDNLQFQSRLEHSLDEHRTMLERITYKYSKYHDKRLEVISSVFSKLADLHFYMQQVTAIIKLVREDFAAEDRARLEDTMNAFKDFRDYFARNRIFISRELCEKLDDLRIKYYNALFEYTYSSEHRDNEISTHLSKSVQTAINITIPDLLSNLEDEFRGVISVEDKAQQSKES